LKGLGLVDEVLPEPLGGAHRDIQATVDSVKAAILKHLDALEKFTPTELLAQREKRLDGFGVFRDH
jgi:acetyl-CoA carboxylase carboxyl transferase subunit alpha